MSVIFFDFDSGKTDIQVVVQWYYRPHDTSLPVKQHDKCEIFESDMTDTNSIEAIDSKCIVHPWTLRDKDVDTFKHHYLRDEFYCRSKYDPAKSKFSPLSAFSEKKVAVDQDDVDSDYAEKEGDFTEEDEDESEEEAVEVTPAKRKATRGPKSSKASTPHKTKSQVKRSRVRLDVPNTQERKKREGIEMLKSKLHVASVPDSLPCREVGYLFSSSFLYFAIFGCNPYS